jgi:group I intron endonuclease
MQIYKITNKVNSKIYIGKDEANKPDYLGSGKLIKRAIKKHGKSSFTKEILEECSDKTKLQEREKFWIKKYNSQDPKIGYNITPGGEGGDTISNNPERESIIAKISAKLKGRVFTEEHKEKLKHSHNSKDPEVAKKISAKLKGRIFTEEHKEKIREANLGKKRSPESIEKNRVAMKNTKWAYNPITGEEKRVLKDEQIDDVDIGKFI